MSNPWMSWSFSSDNSESSPSPALFLPSRIPKHSRRSPPPRPVSGNLGQRPRYFQPPPPSKMNLNKCKGHRFVTLDGLQYQTTHSYDEIAGTFQWEMCEDQVDRCVEFIRDQCADRRVFLVASGDLGAQVVPKIHHWPQLYAVYIHCADVDGHRKWAKDYYKVRVVCFDDVHDLLPQFAVDVAQSLIDWGDALFKAGNREKAKEKYQRAFEILPKYGESIDPQLIADAQIRLNHCLQNNLCF